MNRKHSKPPIPIESPSLLHHRRIWPPALLLLLTLSSTLTIFAVYLLTDIHSPASSQVAAHQPTTRPSSPAFSKADCQALTGRWVRPDGGYVLHIKAINRNGHIDVAYFNPHPINVHKALASRDGSATKLFIELRDVNYPGSTYTLTYEPQADRLTGIYYQALLRQQFQVAFLRMR